VLPSRPDQGQLIGRLDDVRRVWRARRRRILVSLTAAGLVVAGGGTSIVVLLGGAAPSLITILLPVVWLMLLGVMPTDTRAIGLAITIAVVISVNLGLLAFYYTSALRGGRNAIGYYCLVVHAANVAACARAAHRLVAQRTARGALDLLWRAVAPTMVCAGPAWLALGVLELEAPLSNTSYSRAELELLSSGAIAGVRFAVGFELLALGALSLWPRLREAVQTRLASLGEGVSAAAGIAAAISAVDRPEVILARARSTFRSVWIDALSPHHFENNAPADEAYALSRTFENNAPADEAYALSRTFENNAPADEAYALSSAAPLGSVDVRAAPASRVRARACARLRASACGQLCHGRGDRGPGGCARRACACHVPPSPRPVAPSPSPHTRRLHRPSSRHPVTTSQAFISHSWQDSGAEKWRLVQEWRREFLKHNGGREPTVWLDRRAPPLRRARARAARLRCALRAAPARPPLASVVRPPPFCLVTPVTRHPSLRHCGDDLAGVASARPSSRRCCRACRSTWRAATVCSRCADRRTSTASGESTDRPTDGRTDGRTN
jgi:hypothetical protein